MHHFSKHFKKKLLTTILLPIGSALITVLILDIIACLSWFFNDYGHLFQQQDEKSNDNLSIADIFYWIFVTYRVILSLLLCIGGIFMGRRLVVIVWLLLSMIVDGIHLSETIFVLSKPIFIKSWPIFIAVSSSIWGELKILRIKYRIIRRTFNADWNNNNNNNDMCKNQETNLPDQIQTNVVNFVKLARNLYNLMTWHLTGFLFGGGYYKLLRHNYRAVFLEQNVIRYIRIFLDALTVIYILQEKNLLLTPWIAFHILSVSSLLTIFLFILSKLNLMTSLFVSVYYVVFSIDLFFRFGFFIYCIRLIIRRKELI